MPTIRDSAAASALARPCRRRRSAREVLLEKYAKGDERSVDDVRARVARALAAAEAPSQRAHWEARFLEALSERLHPRRAASTRPPAPRSAATLINCFVQPVGDSIAEVVDGQPGIYTALTEAAETMRRGGGVGYDFSRIRPDGAWVGSTQSQRVRAGVSYMRVFDRSCETVESAGARRGAQMGVLRCDHPDIEEFIHAKDAGDLTNFNISVGVTDAFMQAVEDDARDRARAPRRAGRGAEGGRRLRGATTACGSTARSRARELWDQIMRSTYDHAEPGVLFLDRINRDNNLGYCETHRGDQPVRRAAAAAVRLLLPRLDRPHALRARRRSSRRRALRRRRASPSVVAGRGAHARQRARRHRLAAAAAARGSERQAPRRPRLHRPGRRAGDARPALRHATRRAPMARAHRRGDARRGLRRLGRAGARARRVPAVQRRPLPVAAATSRRACRRR